MHNAKTTQALYSTLLLALSWHFTYTRVGSVLCHDHKGVVCGEVTRWWISSFHSRRVWYYISSIHNVDLPFLVNTGHISVVVEVAILLQDKPTSVPALD